jgi:uncharacterized protein
MELLHLEWDENKRGANLAKHGLDFALLAEFDWTRAVLVPDLRRDYGELRFRAFGLVRDMACTVVFTRRGSALRIISLRRSSRHERARYESAEKDRR